MAEGQKEKVVDSTKNKVTMLPITLGSLILKFELPLTTIDAINKSYDENLRNLRPHNKQLAGKIKEENQVTDLLTEEMKQTFLACFGQYLKQIQKPFWAVSLAKAWINEMRSGEYNPFHYHVTKDSDVGLSSVLMLKRPDTYGKEITNPEDPSNGWLEFTGGQSRPTWRITI